MVGAGTILYIEKFDSFSPYDGFAPWMSQHLAPAERVLKCQSPASPHPPRLGESNTCPFPDASRRAAGCYGPLALKTDD